MTAVSRPGVAHGGEKSALCALRGEQSSEGVLRERLEPVHKKLHAGGAFTGDGLETLSDAIGAVIRADQGLFGYLYQ
jgi:hypothetical protein